MSTKRRSAKPTPRKVHQDSSTFTWTLAANVAAAAQDLFSLARGSAHHVDVFCNENSQSRNYGALYVSVDTVPETWNLVTIDGFEPVSSPAPVGYIMKLSGFHTRDQWTAQVHAKLGRLPVLTPANGWVG